MKVSIIVPVYNASKWLSKLISEIRVFMENFGDESELILVNDGSKDNSWEIISSFADRTDTIRGINLMRNYGQQNALLCGLRAAKYDVCVTLDDDLQNPPSEIPRLLATLEDGYDVVYGVPQRQQHEFYRRATSQLIRWILKNMLGAESAEKISSFRAFRTNLRNAFRAYQNSFVCIDVLFTWGTTRFGAVLVEHHRGERSSSSYKFSNLVNLAVTLITSYSAVPLRLATWTGVACIAFGLAALLYGVISSSFELNSATQIPLMAGFITVLSGAQLLALGILGEYVTRMQSSTTDRPPYVVRTETLPLHAAELYQKSAV